MSDVYDHRTDPHFKRFVQLGVQLATAILDARLAQIKAHIHPGEWGCLNCERIVPKAVLNGACPNCGKPLTEYPGVDGDQADPLTNLIGRKVEV